MIEMISSVTARTRPRKNVGQSGETVYTTDFIGPRPGADYPHAFLVQSQGVRIARPHFHEVAEWQIFIGGSGKIGRHDLLPITVHYASAYTPYGPLAPD